MITVTERMVEKGGLRREREMTYEEKCKLVAIHSAINNAMGDTDPDCGDMTDEEIRHDEPLLWAAMHLAAVIGSGSWDKYTVLRP